MDTTIKTYLKNAERLFSNKDYSVYTDRQTKTIMLYNGTDKLYKADIDELIKMIGFKKVKL